METWWQGLSTLTQVFFLGALFFSIISGGQLIAMLFGIGHFHDHADHAVGMHHVGAVSGAGHHAHAAHHHGSHEGDKSAFTFVSLRSLIAFGMLFFWAGTLYLIGGTSPILAIGFSVIWGLVGMFAVSYLMFRLIRLEEIGNVDLSTALLEEGAVYISIPADGVGQIRVKVSGRISYIKARSKTGEPIIRGTRVVVVGISDRNVVEIEPIENQKGD